MCQRISILVSALGIFRGFEIGFSTVHEWQTNGHWYRRERKGVHSMIVREWVRPVRDGDTLWGSRLVNFIDVSPTAPGSLVVLCFASYTLPMPTKELVFGFPFTEAVPTHSVFYPLVRG